MDWIILSVDRMARLLLNSGIWGWRAFRIEGVLDFSLIGILAISTFNTDYVLTKASDFNMALESLAAEGYEIN